MSLRDRCKEHYQRMGRDQMPRQGSPVDDLVAFVISEIGRAADERLEDSLPLCLYFANDEDRREFIVAIHEAKPDMVVKTWP